MTAPEDKFTHELEIFRTEAQSGIQYFYTYLSIQSILSVNPKALKNINKTPLFWGTNISALQISSFITLGRIFDNCSKHNISKLLDSAKKHKEIFSKQALAIRKTRDSKNTKEWLPQYLQNVHVPTQTDFDRLEKHIERYKGIYEQNYKKIRNKIYAHKEFSDNQKVSDLFKKTNIRELEHIFVFLLKFYNALWELFHNGRKPVLRPMPYSVKSMSNKESFRWGNIALQQDVVRESQKFFAILDNDSQHSASR